MAMQESDNMDQTDTSKGTSSGSSNWSPFNMNMDQLSRLGCDSACARSLGQYDGSYDIDKAVYYLVKGLRGGTAIGGTCDFLNYHRDGYTGRRLRARRPVDLWGGGLSREPLEPDTRLPGA
jgi:hypothetical protein